jgi:site-specific recombinase XerD
MQELILRNTGKTKLSTGTGSRNAVDPATGYIMSLKSPRSRLVMTSYLNKIAESFGVTAPNKKHAHRFMNWAQIDRYQLLAFIESLRQQDRSPDTVRVYLSAIKGVMTEAWVQGVIDAEHLERIKLVKGGRGERLSKGRRLTPDEIKPLIQSCMDGTVKGARDAAMTTILLECGLRRSEIVSIEMKHINAAGDTIRVTGKGDKERKAYLPELSRKLLKEWVQDYRGTEPGKLFLRIRKNDDIEFERTVKNKKTGLYETVPGGLTSQAVLHILEQRTGVAGIDRFSPHDLRRTLATSLFERDVDALTVQKIMGHTNLSTTERYDLRGEESVRKVQSNFGYF